MHKYHVAKPLCWIINKELMIVGSFYNRGKKKKKNYVAGTRISYIKTEKKVLCCKSFYLFNKTKIGEQLFDLYRSDVRVIKLKKRQGQNTRAPIQCNKTSWNRKAKRRPGIYACRVANERQPFDFENRSRPERVFSQRRIEPKYGYGLPSAPSCWVCGSRVDRKKPRRM